MFKSLFLYKAFVYYLNYYVTVMISNMLRAIGALVYIAAFVEPSLKTQSIKVVGEDELELGSCGATVHIGKLPSLYNLTNEDKKVSANAGQTLEQLRSFFPTGILSIPSLDPYKSNKINKISISPADTTLLTGKIEIHEVLLQGGKSFNLKSLQIRMKNNLRADFDVEIPLLHGHVLIHADLNLGGILPMKMKGKVKINIKKIRVKGAVGAIETTGEGNEVYQLKNLHVNIRAAKVHVSLKGFGRSLVQDALRFLRKSNFQNASTVESTTKLVSSYVAKKAIEEVNKMLNGFSVNQIKAFLENSINLKS